MDELIDALEDMEDDAQFLDGDELYLLEMEMDEYIIWVEAYQNEINVRKVITTPPWKPICSACENGENNQEGHYGYCIPYPAWMEE